IRNAKKRKRKDIERIGYTRKTRKKHNKKRFNLETQKRIIMINKIFNPGNYSKNIDLSLLILRLAGGGFMLTHGIGKFFKLFGNEPIQFADPLGVGITASLALTVFAEVFCALRSEERRVGK